MKIDTTPQNQISPRLDVEVRTDTLRRCLRDLRKHGWEIATALGGNGSRNVTLDDGKELHLTHHRADGGGWYTMTCAAHRLGAHGKAVAIYNIYPR